MPCVILIMKSTKCSVSPAEQRSPNSANPIPMAPGVSFKLLYCTE